MDRLGVDPDPRAGQKGPVSERSAAWLAHQTWGLGVGSSNLPAPTNPPAAALPLDRLARRASSEAGSALSVGLVLLVLLGDLLRQRVDELGIDLGRPPVDRPVRLIRSRLADAYR